MKLFVAAALFATTALGADVIALGISAPKANEVIVRIDGQPTHVRLEGVPDASDAARDFLQCLVAGRVVRVDVARGRVTMLDGNSANDHVLEYLQTKTKIDPCQLGKAAYVKAGAPAATTTAPAVTPEPGAAPAEVEPVVKSEPLPQPAKPAAKPRSKPRAKAKPKKS